MLRLLPLGGVATLLLLAWALLTYVNTRDPALLMAALMAALLVWLILLVVHVIRDGIPVRIIREDVRPPRDVP